MLVKKKSNSAVKSSADMDRHISFTSEIADLDESRDGDVSVRISDDQTRAYLNCCKAVGKGTQLSLKQVANTLKQSGIPALDMDKIKKDILAFYHSDKSELQDYLIKEGTLPVRGPDRSFEYLVDFFDDEENQRVLNLIEEKPQLQPQIKSFQDYPAEMFAKRALVKKDKEIGKLSRIIMGEKGVDIFNREIPGLPGNDPEIKLLENLRWQKDSIIAEIDGMLEIGEKGGRTIMRVQPFGNARIEINISSDSMGAYLTLERHRYLGKPLTEEAVRQKLEDEKVFYGIKEDVLSDIINKALHGEMIENVLVAQGLPSTNGLECVVQFNIQFEGNRNKTVKGRAREELEKKALVNKDTYIGEFFPPSNEPREGTDIHGESLTPKKQDGGEPQIIEISKYIRQEKTEEGKVLLYADRGGLFTYDGQRMQLHHIQDIKGNVDRTTGNIRFPGSVLIRGGIQPGFFVLAGQDIQVEDTVIDALLSADGNIKLKSGIKGTKKAALRSKKNILVNFAEDCKLLAVENITVNNACLRAQVKCNGKMIFTSDKGKLIGGRVLARKGMEVHTLGSPKGIKTQVSFGQDYLIEDQIEVEKREMKKIQQEINKMDLLMQKVLGNKIQLNKIRQRKLGLMKLLQKRGDRLFNLMIKFEEHFPGEIRIFGTAYPGVIIESHSRTLSIDSPRNDFRIIFNTDKGKLEIK